MFCSLPLSELLALVSSVLPPVVEVAAILLHLLPRVLSPQRCSCAWIRVSFVPGLLFVGYDPRLSLHQRILLTSSQDSAAVSYVSVYSDWLNVQARQVRCCRLQWLVVLSLNLGRHCLQEVLEQGRLNCPRLIDQPSQESQKEAVSYSHVLWCRVVQKRHHAGFEEWVRSLVFCSWACSVVLPPFFSSHVLCPL